MIERIRCIPVLCPWGLQFYSLSPQCEWCYRKCLKLRQACARKGSEAHQVSLGRVRRAQGAPEKKKPQRGSLGLPAPLQDQMSS